MLDRSCVSLDCHLLSNPQLIREFRDSNGKTLFISNGKVSLLYAWELPSRPELEALRLPSEALIQIVANILSASEFPIVEVSDTNLKYGQISSKNLNVIEVVGHYLKAYKNGIVQKLKESSDLVLHIYRGVAELRSLNWVLSEYGLHSVNSSEDFNILWVDDEKNIWLSKW